MGDAAPRCDRTDVGREVGCERGKEEIAYRDSINIGVGTEMINKVQEKVQDIKAVCAGAG